MVSNPCSSHEPFEATIDASSLARLSGDDSSPLCVIDCRAEGITLKRATRVRLPHVILRRLQSGSISMASVCPQLSEPAVQVVILPEEADGSGQMSQTIRNSLRNSGLSLHVFIGSVEEAVAKFPQLRASSPAAVHSTVSPTAVEGDVSWMNLKALRIEPDSQGGGRPREKQKQIFPVQILPHLFLGNAETAGNRDFLKRLGVTHIVNVTSNLPNAFESDANFRYLRISVDDNCSHNLSQHFPEAIAFISSAADSGGICLVHCLAGISRSVTICIAYLMAINRWTLEVAYDEVLRCNGSIAPNFHFMGQLSEYERHLGLISQSQTPRTASSICLPPPPLSPSCGVEAAAGAAHQVQTHHFPPSACLTPPPTSCSASPHSNSSHSAKSFAD